MDDIHGFDGIFQQEIHKFLLINVFRSIIGAVRHRQPLQQIQGLFFCGVIVIKRLIKIIVHDCMDPNGIGAHLTNLFQPTAIIFISGHKVQHGFTGDVGG